MDFGDSPAEAAYRQRLREWLGWVLPGIGDRSDKRASLYRTAATRKWQHLLYDAGDIGQTWPKEIGGQGLGPTFDFILNEECALARAPSLPTNVNYLGRSIAAFGSAAQRDKFLPQTMSGDIHWCQGFSEPSGGSDLAGLRTRAVRDGDRYLVNGQKLWTSGAPDADWCFLLARTETGKPRHQSISVLLVDMRSPGIEPHNVRTTDGTEPTGSCFFDDVGVPAENLLGRPGQGWEIAMSALSHKRGPADTGVLALVRRHRPTSSPRRPSPLERSGIRACSGPSPTRTCSRRCSGSARCGSSPCAPRARRPCRGAGRQAAVVRHRAAHRAHRPRDRRRIRPDRLGRERARPVLRVTARQRVRRHRADPAQPARPARARAAALRSPP